MLVKKSKFILNSSSINNISSHSTKSSSILTFNQKLLARDLIIGKLLVDGRNSAGRITVLNRGSGVKHRYRIVDFFHYIWNMKAQVLTAEYDPNRSTLLNLVLYTHGVLSYILSVEGTKISSTLSFGSSYAPNQTNLAYCSHLKFIKPGAFINSIESCLLKGAQYARSAGAYAKLVSLTLNHAIVKLRSQFLLKLNNRCIATIGVLSSSRPTKTRSMRKAGFTRRLGFRPSVRGVAKNPIDHPHGGGQGKTSGGRTSVTPWAEITKGKKTRRKLNYGSFVLKR